MMNALNLSPKVSATACSLCRTHRLTGCLPAADPESAVGRFPFLLETDRRSGAAGVPEPSPTSTQSLFLSISATLPSASAACSYSKILPMRLSCNDIIRIPSKLEVPTRWPLMTRSFSCKNCRSRIPPSDFISARVVRSRKVSWDRFIVADPHHRESKLRCRAGQGTYILCSKGMQAQYSSSKQYTTHHRTASIRNEKHEKKRCCSVFICMLAEGKGFCLAKK